MRKRKKTVRRRLFLSNTCMVLVTLMIFLIVNLCIIKFYEETLKRKMVQSSEMAPYADDVKKIIENWKPGIQKQDYRFLADEIGQKNFELCVFVDDEVLYSNVEDEEWEEQDDLEKYLKSDEESHIFLNYDLTVVTRYDALNDIEIYAVAGKYDEEYWLWQGNFTAFLMLFIIDGVLCVGGLLLISQLFTRNLARHILKPLGLLLEGAERVQKGILTAPVNYTGDIEYENVCKTFNEMQQHILSEQEKNKKYEKARTDLVAGISHDLRTPLTAIQGTIKGLMDGVASTPRQRQRFLQIAYRRIGDMDVLLQRLFYFSKLETGNMPLILKRTNLSNFVKDYLKIKKESLEGEQFSIEEWIEDGVYVNIDIEQMQRIFDNLIENSFKYAGRSHIVIKICLRKVDEAAVLSIADNGVGVPEEKLPHIFEQFYRGDESRNEKDGNGLGLYIVKYLIESMKGRVWAENRQGLAIEMKLSIILEGENGPEA